MKKAFLMLALGGAGLFSACNKDKNDPAPADNLQGKWQLEQSNTRLSVGGVVLKDTAVRNADLDACLQDNFMAFAPNGVGYISKGATLCAGEAATADSFSYALTNNNKSLYIGARGYNDTFNLKTLNNSSLVFYKDYSTNGGMLTVETSFKKIP